MEKQAVKRRRRRKKKKRKKLKRNTMNKGRRKD